MYVKKSYAHSVYGAGIWTTRPGLPPSSQTLERSEQSLWHDRQNGRLQHKMTHGFESSHQQFYYVKGTEKVDQYSLLQFEAINTVHRVT